MSLEHRSRVITALLGVAAIFTIYYYFRHTGLIFLTTLLSVIAYGELLKMAGSNTKDMVLPLGLGALLSVWLCLEFPGELIVFYLGTLVLIFFEMWRVHFSAQDLLPKIHRSLQTQIFGLFYLIALPSFVVKIHSQVHGPSYLVFLLGIVWIGDTGAYYGGKLMGKNKLAPHISPGKTWEGSVSALVFCSLYAAIFQWIALPFLPIFKVIIMGIFASIVAQAGDLFESLIKRAYNAKDSGSLLPGHGGVFDRFDSIILSSPFFYFLMHVLG